MGTARSAPAAPADAGRGQAAAPARGQVQPLLVVFEDLHWIDAETQALLDSLVESLPTARCSCWSTTAPSTARLGQQDLLHASSGSIRCRPESADELLEALLGPDACSQPLKRVLIARTGGNPFFLEESVRTLVETEALVGERGAYRLAQPVDTLQVPGDGPEPSWPPASTACRPRRSGCSRPPPSSARTVAFALLQAVADESEEELRAEARPPPGRRVPLRDAALPGPRVHVQARAHPRGGLRQPAPGAAAGAPRPDRRRDRAPSRRPSRGACRAAGPPRLPRRGLGRRPCISVARRARRRSTRSAYREAAAYLEQALEALPRPAGEPGDQELAIDLRLDLRTRSCRSASSARSVDYLARSGGAGRRARRSERLGWVRLYICHLLLLSRRARAVGGSARSRRRRDRGRPSETAGSRPTPTSGSAAALRPRRAPARGGPAPQRRRRAADLIERFTRRDRASAGPGGDVPRASSGEFAEAETAAEITPDRRGARGPTVQPRERLPGRSPGVCLPQGGPRSGDVAARARPRLCRTLELQAIPRQPGRRVLRARPRSVRARHPRRWTCWSRALRQARRVRPHVAPMPAPALSRRGVPPRAAASTRRSATADRGASSSRASAAGAWHSRPWALRAARPRSPRPPRPPMRPPRRTIERRWRWPTELGMRPLVAHCHLGLGKLYRRTGDDAKAAGAPDHRGDDVPRDGHDASGWRRRTRSWVESSDDASLCRWSC